MLRSGWSAEQNRAKGRRSPCASCSSRRPAWACGWWRARPASTRSSPSPASSGRASPSPATPTTSATAACRSWGAARSATCASSRPRAARRDPAAPGPLPHLLLRRHQGPGRPRRSWWREAEARGIPVLVHPRGVHALHQAALRLPGRAAGPAPAPALGADRRLRPRRPDRGGERDRQVGVRARPHRPRPPAGGRRRGGDQARMATPSSAPRPTSRATTWSCAASASSTSRTSTASPRSASRKRVELVVSLERWEAGTGVRSARPPGREVPDPGRRRCR